MEGCRDDSDRCFNAMDSGADSAQACERGDEPDSAVAAHSNVSDIIEEDHASGAGFVDRLTEKRADDDVGTSWLIDDGCPEVIMQTQKAVLAIGQWASAEVGSSVDDEPRRLSGGVRVEDRNAAWGSSRWHFVISTLSPRG